MDNVISLSKFLSRYCSLKGVDLKKVTHAEVKVLFPYIKRSSFNELKRSRELLCSGKVLLVSDGCKTIPYYVPELCYDMDNDPMELNREEEAPLLVDDNVYDYVNMSEYRLRCLLRKKFNSFRNQRAARKELDSRGIPVTKKYVRKEYKIIKEE